MVALSELWLPIILSAVFVFLASSIVHMVLRYHKSEYRGLPDEAATLETLRKQGLTPGQYILPYASSPKDCNTPEMLAKFRQGPVGYLTVIPNGPPPMGKNLALWFLYTLLVGLFVAYLTGRTLGAGTDYLAVFRVAGTTAFMSYGLASLVDSIWKGQRWSTTVKFVFDGLVYALLTAGTFGWLWPR
jgi:hypothetical protein